jgi:hypothetical protein
MLDRSSRAYRLHRQWWPSGFLSPLLEYPRCRPFTQTISASTSEVDTGPIGHSRHKGMAMHRRCSSPCLEGWFRVVAMPGELVRTTDGKWITRPPSRCPNGHPLGPNQVLVNHVACLGHGGGHTYGPPFAKHCTTLEGPAAVRISNVT